MSRHRQKTRGSLNQVASARAPRVGSSNTAQARRPFKTPQLHSERHKRLDPSQTPSTNPTTSTMHSRPKHRLQLTPKQPRRVMNDSNHLRNNSSSTPETSQIENNVPDRLQNDSIGHTTIAPQNTVGSSSCEVQQQMVHSRHSRVMNNHQRTFPSLSNVVPTLNKEPMALNSNPYLGNLQQVSSLTLPETSDFISIPPGYQIPPGAIPNPHNSRRRSSNGAANPTSRSFQSPGNDFKLALETVNANLPEEQRIPVIIFRPRCLSNYLMRVMGGVLAKNEVFSKHLGRMTYENIRRCTPLNAFRAAYHTCISQMETEAPIARSASNNWLAHRCMVNKLSNDFYAEKKRIKQLDQRKNQQRKSNIHPRQTNGSPKARFTRNASRSVVQNRDTRHVQPQSNSIEDQHRTVDDQIQLNLNDSNSEPNEIEADKDIDRINTTQLADEIEGDNFSSDRDNDNVPENVVTETEGNENNHPIDSYEDLEDDLTNYEECEGDYSSPQCESPRRFKRSRSQSPQSIPMSQSTNTDVPSNSVRVRKRPRRYDEN